MSKCPHCERKEQQVKIGYNKSGSQRYLCKVCRRKYTPEPRPHGYSTQVRRQAIQHYVDGMNLRRIGRILGVDHHTVGDWIEAYTQSLPDSPPLPDGELAVSELDELFTFIGEKKTKSTS